MVVEVHAQFTFALIGAIDCEPIIRVADMLSVVAPAAAWLTEADTHLQPIPRVNLVLQLSGELPDGTIVASERKRQVEALIESMDPDLGTVLTEQFGDTGVEVSAPTVRVAMRSTTSASRASCAWFLRVWVAVALLAGLTGAVNTRVARAKCCRLATSR